MRKNIGLFRGKRIDNGEWVEGNLILRHIWTQRPVFIWVNDFGFDNYEEYEVDPDTIGECTGLKDKNGKLIFEGDIVTFRTRTSHFNSPMYVRWYEEDARFVVSLSDEVRSYPMSKSWEYEIIGNVIDNPELLKGGES